MGSKATHIRVTLNDELTWAEREAFAEFLQYAPEITGHSIEKIDKEAKVINLYSLELSSRDLYKFVHYLLAQEFTNLYIKSVKTVNPKVKV